MTSILCTGVMIVVAALIVSGEYVEELITGVNVSNVEDETGDAGSDQSEAAFISENIQRMLITGSLETCYISINWLKEVRMFLLQSESGGQEGGGRVDCDGKY